jgi:glycosyltransferase 2 family protein
MSQSCDGESGAGDAITCFVTLLLHANEILPPGRARLSVGSNFSAARQRDVTGTFAQTITSRLGRSTIGAAISVAILGGAGYTLYELLRGIEFDKVLAALAGQPVGKLIAASIFVTASYVALTFYDLFALHVIGRRRVPYSIAALASFTSSTIGHNLGAAVLTGGLIRLRIYSRWGLTLGDIAKIAVLTGITFWLGNAFLLSVATAYIPEAATAVDHLPPWLNRAIGFAGLFGVGCYLLWLAAAPRAVGSHGWRIVLPNFRFTLLQIGIGALDLILVTLAMYVLLPAARVVDLPSVMVVFLSATLLGTVSHAPAGLGVIEATMLLGLPHCPKEELLASLLTFRALYFLLPLLLAALSLGARELRMLATATKSR